MNLISAMFAVNIVIEHCLKGSKQTCSISVLEERNWMKEADSKAMSERQEGGL